MLNNAQALLSLLQLSSPALPIGAYSYSEGLETLVANGKIKNEQTLQHWLEEELHYGAIQLEAAVMLRAYRSTQIGEASALAYWNHWLSAAKETEELRQQSWQMGQSLMRLMLLVSPPGPSNFTPLKSLATAAGNPCNLAIAFGIAAAYWQIDASDSVLLGYLHSWATNLITAGVKLIPIGQTSGQKLLLELHSCLTTVTSEILSLTDDDLNSSGWGLALASMAHETQYTRLFRS